MSEKELNAYRLTSMEEPTDEMLSTIMKEAAEEAAASTAKALAEYFKEINTMLQKKCEMRPNTVPSGANVAWLASKA